ncbi:acetyl-CoA carboxylase biotin carboxyl carrier protein subunit [Leuconostoc sp. MS02]|uniref:Biotin carboxyl carrier protein of acetyl-CoA carboxylase n=1 Tax=Leuconostoc aquikimchii TaxID=3236804 RepID=A0ABV3S4A3_9LACO
MKIKDITAIVKILNHNHLSQIHFKQDEFEIDVSKEWRSTSKNDLGIDEKNEDSISEENYIISSTIGTFYSSADPDSKPFIDVGDKVNSNTVVGIVEVMKMMTNVLANNDGKIDQILVSNGETIEYGQKLFRLE